MAWHVKIELPDPDTFDPNQKYTDKELENYASAFLKRDIKENGNINHILFEDHLTSRGRREIGVDPLKIDESITNALPKNDQRPVDHSGDGQMIYNRSHPKGRKQNSKEQRSRNGASYYR